jgi:hypothetical protein
MVPPSGRRVQPVAMTGGMPHCHAPRASLQVAADLADSRWTADPEFDFRTAATAAPHMSFHEPRPPRSGPLFGGVPNAIGKSGVSEDLGEHDLGGVSAMAKVVIGR